MVTDLQKDQRYYFICDRWLAVDEDDGQVEGIRLFLNELDKYWGDNSR